MSFDTADASGFPNIMLHYCRRAADIISGLPEHGVIEPIAYNYFDKLFDDLNATAAVARQNARRSQCRDDAWISLWYCGYIRLPLRHFDADDDDYAFTPIRAIYFPLHYFSPRDIASLTTAALKPPLPLVFEGAPAWKWPVALMPLSSHAQNIAIYRTVKATAGWWWLRLRTLMHIHFSFDSRKHLITRWRHFISSYWILI